MKCEILHSKCENKNTYYVLKILSCLLLIIILNACTYKKEKIYKKSKIMMDTVITISVVSNSKDHAENAMDTAFSEIERLEALFDFFSPDSEVSLINNNAGIVRVKVSMDMIYVLDKAFFVSEKTGGAFDVTTGPLLVLYDFKHGLTPKSDIVTERLSLVNYKALSIDKNDSTVFLNKEGMLIDLGGISKGFAADKAVEVLKREGVVSGLVAVAGDIRAFGLKPNKKPWKIGIRNPRSERRDDIIAAIDLKDMAISTSGDYERYFIVNGERYHHLISPVTGRPVHSCQSVSIIAEEGVLADAFSTGVFILGPKKGIQVIEKMGFDGFIIDKEGNIHVTSDIREKIELKRAPEEYNKSR